MNNDEIFYIKTIGVREIVDSLYQLNCKNKNSKDRDKIFDGNKLHKEL